MPDPDLGSSVQPNPDLPANLPAVRPLSSIIPASWTGGFLRDMQSTNAPLGSPQNPINLPYMQTIDPNAPRSPMDIMRDRLGGMFGQPGGGAAQPPEVTPPAYRPVPAWQSPYIPVGPRPGGQIGDEWWPVAGAMNYPGSYGGLGIPSGMQALGVMGRAGGILSRWGPPSASPFYGRASGLAMQLGSVLDLLSKGKFSKNQLAMRQGQLQLMQDEMLFNMQQGLMAHQQELLKYQEVLNAFHNNAYSQDETENARIAHQKIEELAQTNPNILGVLKNGGMNAVENYLIEEDRHFRDAYAGFASAKKSRDATGGESVFDETGGGGAGAKTDPLAPTKVAGPAETAAPADTGGVKDVIPDIKKAYGNLNDVGIDYARKKFRGEITNAELQKMKPDPNNPRIRPGTAIGLAGTDMQNRFDRIAASPTGTVEDKLKQVEGFDPATAEDLRQLVSYNKDPKEFSKKNDMQAHMTQMAGRIDPSYRPDQFAVVHDIVKKAELPLIGAQQLDTAGNELLRVSLKFKEGERMPARWFDQAIAGSWTGDPKYVEYRQALIAYANAVSRSESGQGRPYATIVRQMIHDTETTPNPAAMRAMVRVDNNVGWSLIDSFNKSFQSYTGQNTRNIPGWREDIANNMKAKQAMTDSGEMPEWAPPNMLALSRKPSDRDRPAWRTKEQERPPLTREQISDLERIANAPDASEDLKQRARRMLLEGGVTR